MFFILNCFYTLSFFFFLVVFIMWFTGGIVTYKNLNWFLIGQWYKVGWNLYHRMLHSNIRKVAWYTKKLLCTWYFMLHDTSYMKLVSQCKAVFSLIIASFYYHRNKRLQEVWITCLVKFLPFKCSNSNKELWDNFDSKKNLVGLIIRIISSIESFFLSLIVFKILAENC